MGARLQRCRPRGRTFSISISTPFTEGFQFVPAGDIDALRAAVKAGGVCGVLLELIQGEEESYRLTRRLSTRPRRSAVKNDVLLMADEVQTGVGRTGRLLCCEHYGVTPDLVSLAKGLGGGLPIGAVLLGEKCADTLGPGVHGSTFGGNPVACAGACEVLRRLDGALLCEVEEKGAYITERVLAMPRVKRVDGKGLMLGVTLGGMDSKTAAAACLEHGLIIFDRKGKAADAAAADDYICGNRRRATEFKRGVVTMKHLLKLLDLSGEQITELLNLGDQLKYEQKHGIDHQRLKGQTLGMIFQKSSTRTRVSFEVGIHQLGGTGLFLSANDLQIGRGEPVQDTARTFALS